MWAADGTFDRIPTLFHQIYTIHPLRDDSAVPVIYALLPGKRDDLYFKMLRALLTLKPNIKPRVILTDFGRAALNAFQQFFPDSIQRPVFSILVNASSEK